MVELCLRSHVRRGAWKLTCAQGSLTGREVRKVSRLRLFFGDCAVGCGTGAMGVWCTGSHVAIPEIAKERSEDVECCVALEEGCCMHTRARPVPTLFIRIVGDSPIRRSLDI